MHVAPAFSCLEIVDSIYKKMKPTDTFIMSKGHGAMAQYVVLEDMGLLTLDDYGKSIGCHPDLGVPGIAASTGSLGHGLAMALGIAYAEPQNWVYVLLSDGECMEGSTWEALMLANTLKIANLTIYVDYNGTHSSGDIRPAMGNLQHKMAVFCPFLDVRVVETTKGKGVSYMENSPLWHYRSPTPSEYQQALAELA